MCGIYGILSRRKVGFMPAELDVLNQMAILTQLRGIHSSGCFAVDCNTPKTQARIIKCLGPSSFLPYEKGWESWWKFVSEKAGTVVGHGRFATRGSITKKNAHPFTRNHITMVHNGTISSGIDKEHEEEVDSAGLCNQIASLGIKDALNKINGAYAVILQDAQTGLIHFVRNYERPLAFIESNDAIYIMSEKEALSYLYSRSPIPAPGSVKSCEGNTLYTFDPETKNLTTEPLKETFSYAGYSKSSYYENYQNKYTRSSVGKPPTVVEITPPQTNTTAKPTYNPGALIQFKVQHKIDPSNDEKEFMYVGKDEEGNTVYFKTSVENDKAINQIGIGTCITSKWVPTKGSWVYQVKTRTINWDTSLGEEEDEELLTAEGELIPKSVWVNLTETENCCCCMEPVHPDDNEKTMVWEHGNGTYKMVCATCLSSHIFPVTEPKDALTQYDQLRARLLS